MAGHPIERAIEHVPSLSNPFAGGVPDYAVLVELTRSWAPREGEASLDEVLQQIAGEILEQDDSPLVDALFVTSSPIPLKYALNKIGMRVGGTRLPLVPIDVKSQALMDAALKGAQIDLEAGVPA